MGALQELWWVVVIIGAPALIAVLWERHENRKKQQEIETFRRFTDYMNLVQEERDHINMKKIEEARDDFS